MYQRGTVMSKETTMLRMRQQDISILVLRNLLLYSGMEWTPSSQSWYGVARLRFWITWINFPIKFLLVLNSLEVASLTMSMARVWATMMTRNTWNASPRVRKV